jgi:alpha-beta hydrolase superfamily lysophospholipase
MANEMVNSSGPHRSRADLRREIAEGRSVSIDGFSLASEMYTSLAATNLMGLGRPTPAPILLMNIQSRPQRRVKPLISKIVDSYGAEGDICFQTAQGPPVWMRTRLYLWRLEEVFSKILEWTRQRSSGLTQSGAGVQAISDRFFNRGSIERSVGFEVDGTRVWGILHLPRNPVDDGPGVVLIAAGEACRSAFFYTRLARVLADEGLHVLRFDPRGIGDSHGDFGCDQLFDVFNKLERGALVPDVLAALDFIERETGSKVSILTGLCGGAITSVFVAEGDDRVVGIAPIELPMTLTPLAEERKEPKISRVVPWDEALSQRGSTLFLLAARRMAKAVATQGKYLARRLTSAFLPYSTRDRNGASWYTRKIGKEVNADVLVALESVLRRTVPVCCLFAEEKELRRFSLVISRLMEALPPEAPVLDVRVIKGADHNFVMPGCAERLSTELVDWLDSARKVSPPGAPRAR